jgi:hypothetical protein
MSRYTDWTIPAHDEHTYVIQCSGGCEMLGNLSLSGGPELKWWTLYEVLKVLPSDWAEGLASGHGDAGSSNLVYDTIWYDIFNCNWVDTRWQWSSTHLHTIHRIQRRNIHNIKKKLNIHSNQKNLLIWEVRAVPRLWRVIPWHLPYNWGKSTENPQLG